MSIITKTGDSGKTTLMYQRRVSKCDPRVEAYGSVDELNAALGLARTSLPEGALNDQIRRVQDDLIGLMGELATHPEDLPRYMRDGYQRLAPDADQRLESWAREVEQRLKPARGWAVPGQSPAAAALDVARTVCRRAERRVCALLEAGQADSAPIVIYLNRLSDLLWLHARQMEQTPNKSPAT